MERECVTALTPAAARLGIKLGMRRAGVCTLAPQALLLARDRGAEAVAFEEAALALLQYTPEIASAAEHTLLMNVGASLQFFGGPRALLHRTAQTLNALHLRASLGMAPTARGAWMLARPDPLIRQRRVLSLPTLTRRLDALACTFLPEAQEHHDWLHHIGCHTLADLRRLPRAGSQQRCGPALLRALDQAYAQAPEMTAWLPSTPRFVRRVELTEQVEHTEAVLAVARQLTEQLSSWLTARQLAVHHLALTLHHERGRYSCAPTVVSVSMAQAAWQSAHLLSLLGEKLSRLTLPSSVIAVTLQAPSSVPQPAINTTLLPQPADSSADHAQLLDLLRARLGAVNVRHAAPLADHRPEVANHWEARRQGVTGPPVLPPSVERPFWLLDPPLALRVSRYRPVYAGSPLTLLRGPERIESGWWDARRMARDYFVAEDSTGARYWIYRERSAEDVRWFLHGLFA